MAKSPKAMAVIKAMRVSHRRRNHRCTGGWLTVSPPRWALQDEQTSAWSHTSAPHSGQKAVSRLKRSRSSGLGSSSIIVSPPSTSRQAFVPPVCKNDKELARDGRLEADRRAIGTLPMLFKIRVAGERAILNLPWTWAADGTSKAEKKAPKFYLDSRGHEVGCPTALGYAGRAVDRTGPFGDEPSSDSLAEVSVEGSKKQAKMRNANVSSPHCNGLHRPGVLLGPLSSRSIRCSGLRALPRPGPGHRRSVCQPLRWELEVNWEILAPLALVQCPWITPPSGTPRSAPVEGVGRRFGPWPITIFLLTCDGKSVPILEIAQDAFGPSGMRPPVGRRCYGDGWLAGLRR